MNRSTRRLRNRRGATVVQWAVIAAIVVIGIIAAVRSIGTNTGTHMTTTAGNVADPSTLPARFGS
jgi:Flp pilus assembly pilin Flp